jgi:hypothetical protein
MPDRCNGYVNQRSRGCRHPVYKRVMGFGDGTRRDAFMIRSGRFWPCSTRFPLACFSGKCPVLAARRGDFRVRSSVVEHLTFKKRRLEKRMGSFKELYKFLGV